MNPLDSDDPFDWSGMNPNPTFSKTKEGPIYRISFEVDEETWKCFVDANTKGMIVGNRSIVTERYHEEPEKPKGGKWSQRAGMICQDPGFQDYAKWAWKKKNIAIEFNDEDSASALIYEVCNIDSRAELDHNEQALLRYKDLMKKFEHWGSKNL